MRRPVGWLCRSGSCCRSTLLRTTMVDLIVGENGQRTRRGGRSSGSGDRHGVNGGCDTTTGADNKSSQLNLSRKSTKRHLNPKQCPSLGLTASSIVRSRVPTFSPTSRPGLASCKRQFQNKSERKYGCWEVLKDFNSALVLRVVPSIAICHGSVAHPHGQH